MEGLEERVRRSSRLKDSSAFREFLTYACMVSDEDQIYSYMEENKIGINEPEFWAAKLTMHKNKCEYKQFMKILKQTNQNYEMKKHPKYWLIKELAKQLQKQLQQLVRKKPAIGKKRHSLQYDYRLCQIQKQTRKFGKLQVYVDPDCRMQYRLEDLIDFISTKFVSECSMQRNIYLRQISKRPLSFLGKQKQKLDKLSQEILGFRKNRLSNEKNTNNRLSLVGRKSNKNQCQTLQTPDFKKKSVNKENKKHKQNINQLDSIQILKLARKSVANQQKKRQSSRQQFINILDYTTSNKKQRVRNSSSSQQQIFSQPDADNAHSKSFSFADQIKISLTQQKQNKINRKSRRLNIKIQKQQQEQLKKQNENDIAFIQQTQPEANTEMNFNTKNTKQSLELQNIIKQIQMQKYQSQTMSEIDSNKQNNILSGEQQIINLNLSLSLMDSRDGNGFEKRKKFQTIRKDHLKNNLGGKQKILKGESDSQPEDQSSRSIYKQLLIYLETDHKKNKQENKQQKHSKSAKDKSKIPRISQEQSYIWSQARKTSSRRDKNS